MAAHIALALLIMLPLALLTRSCAAGAAAACAWSISREITQAEYRWIEQYGGGLRANMPWWGGFDPKAWHADAMLDWMLPSLVVVGIAIAMKRRRSRST